MASSPTDLPSPHVAISGAGPAGLLLAILLSKTGVQVTVLEKSLVADPWSSKSYSINLNARGLTALDHAGVLEQAKAAGMARHKVVLESADGARKILPRKPPHYAFSRPDLVSCLEGILKQDHSERVTIRRGVGVKSVEEQENGVVTVTQDDGTTMDCSHVVGADGKWSAVRNSIPAWKDQFQVQSEPAFGISIASAKCPERWEQDATSVFRPKSPKYYVIAAPVISGHFSISAVCFEEIQEEHPWLLPQDEESNTDWEPEYGTTGDANPDFQERFSKLLQEELPAFYKDIDGDTITFRTNRRTSWLKPLVDNPLYCSDSGRVALIGDAAHAMTPAVGEGCNCALESAVSLTKALADHDKAVTTEDLTNAFLEFGKTRPSEVIPVQTRSAANNRYKAPGQATAR